jgi:hypothetical protein
MFNNQKLTLVTDFQAALLARDIIHSYGCPAGNTGAWRSHDWWSDLQERRLGRHVGCGYFLEEARNLRVAIEESHYLVTQGGLVIAARLVAQNVWETDVPKNSADVRELKRHSSTRSSRCRLHLSVELGLHIWLACKLGSEHGEVCG